MEKQSIEELKKQKKQLDKKSNKYPIVLRHLKRMLITIDIELLTNQSIIKIYNAKAEKYKNLINLREEYKNTYYESIANLKVASTYVDELERFKEDLNNYLGKIIGFYYERWQRVILLRFLQEKTYAEIAEETNYSEIAVRTIWHRFLNDLSTSTEPYEELVSTEYKINDEDDDRTIEELLNEGVEKEDESNQ